MKIVGNNRRTTLRLSDVKNLLGLPNSKVATTEDIQDVISKLTNLSEYVDRNVNILTDLAGNQIDVTLFVTQDQKDLLISELNSVIKDIVTINDEFLSLSERVDLLDNKTDIIDSKIIGEDGVTPQVDNLIEKYNVLETSHNEMSPIIQSILDQVNDLDLKQNTISNYDQLDDGLLLNIGIFKVFISKATSIKDGIVNFNYSKANFKEVFFQTAQAYSDSNYTTTGSPNTVSLHKETKTLTTIQGRVKGSEAVGLVGNVLVDKVGVYTELITIGV